ncbi:MAG: tetratricopeptide repeat protein [Magnetococcales bacterium]|nr:tetratricopeptide repeat protein [Magnetococcales bacterium]
MDKMQPPNTHQPQLTIDEAYAKAFDLYNIGSYTEADRLCTAIIQIDNDHLQTINLLGLIAQKIDRHDLAIVQFRHAISIDSRYSMLHYNLGTSLYPLGRTQEAIDALQKAVAIDPDFADAYCTLGAAFLQLGQLAAANLVLQKAISIKPDYGNALYNLGNVLLKQGMVFEAETSYRKVIAVNPGYSAAYFNLGNILKAQNRLDEAVASYQKAISIKPDYVEAYNNLGVTQHEQNKLDQAISSYQQAISIKSDYVEAHNNIGFTLLEKSKLSVLSVEQKIELVSSLKKAVALDPFYTNAWLNLLLFMHGDDCFLEASSILDEALKHQPDSTVLLLRKIHIIFPIFHKNSESVNRSIEIFNSFIAQMSAWLAKNPKNKLEFAKEACNMPVFYIAYLPLNHIQALSDYGDLIAVEPHFKKPDGAIKAKKIRIVIVSNHIRVHSVWDIVLKGFVRHMDRDRFELFLYNTSNITDDETKWAQANADFYRQIGSEDRHKTAWLDILRKDAPDVIYFPEISMDPITIFLALHRTAPLQVMGWGHPITSGLPTIDYFISGELLEPEPLLAQSHYREKLICLPGTGCCTEPLQIVQTTTPHEIEEILNDLVGPIFIICQKSFKFYPGDDALFAKIASLVGPCTFLITVDEKLPWATKNIIKRIGKAFQEKELNPDNYLQVIPWLSNDKFLSLLKSCDIYLDCPSFSGYTTARQAAHMGLPIVTLEGTFMRQRLAAGLLRKIELTDTIAQNHNDYINISIMLAKESRDKLIYKARRKQLAKSAQKADFGIEVVRAFENILTTGLDENGVANP